MTVASAGVGLAGDIDWTTLMVNAIYQPQTNVWVKPYFGLGGGYIPEVALKFTGAGVTDSYATSGRFAVQGLLGASLPLAPSVEAFGELRVLASEEANFTVSDAEISAALDVDVNARLALVGLRIRF